MKVTEKTYKIDLPGIDRPAEIVIRRMGQEHPSDGDRVQVRWELGLPADDLGNLLHGIQFGKRVEVAGWPLYAYWGGSYNEQGPSKVTAGTVKADTWAAAFRQAEDYVRSQLDRLLDALRVRQRALEDAEEE